MFIDYRLDDCVSPGFSGGPAWSTTIVANEGGYEARIQNWAMPHYQYTADYSVLEADAQNQVRDAFIAARGRRDSFRFKDWGDFEATEQSLGTGDGTSTARQLVKFYTFGPTTFTRNILLPIASSVVVTANGSPITVTVDDETGLVTPSSPWPSGQILLASFQFDVRVRFGSDFYPFTMPLRNLAQVSVDLVEALTP